MLLVLDVGNSNTVIGVYDGGRLAHRWRVETHHNRTSDEYGVLLRQLFAISGTGVDAIHSAIISSVVPPLEGVLVAMVEEYFACKPLIVGRSVQPQMPVLCDNPREVGADRLVNAVAAWHRYKTSLIVIDFGTATTFDVVSERGEFLGGAICPGISLCRDALFRAASKLPRVELTRPRSAIATNTVEAMQSGLVFGYIGLVRELVARMTFELGTQPKVIATGGLASLVAADTDMFDHLDEFLTLDGLRIIAQSAAG